jgi:hypothetical protein
VLDHPIHAGGDSPPLAACLAAGCGGRLVQGTAHTVLFPADPSRAEVDAPKPELENRVRRQVHDVGGSSVTRVKV